MKVARRVLRGGFLNIWDVAQPTSCASRLMRQKEKAFFSSLLLYATNENFKEIKQKLKLTVLKLK
jgi:hypothetical protein